MMAPLKETGLAALAGSGPAGGRPGGGGAPGGGGGAPGERARLPAPADTAVAP